MINTLTDGKSITKYQKQFIFQLKSVCKEKSSVIVGNQGESRPYLVYYSEEHNFWFTTHNEHNRYWNAFGLGRPQTEKNNSITVEINFPFNGVNRNIGGAIGRGNGNEVLILHRGKIGGGRFGIGKQLFFKNFRDEPVIVNDDGIQNELCLIGSLNSKLLPKQVGNFVSEIHRIKNLTIDEIDDFAELKDFEFTEETAGRKKIKRTPYTVIERTHGIVVNSLAKLLEDWGHKIGKDRNRDLFIHDRRHIKALFEIKRSSSTQDLYSAVGQLLIYSLPIKTPVDLILVVPDKLKKNIENRLLEYGIRVIYYDWNDGDPIFKDLKKII